MCIRDRREQWYPIKHSDGTISGFNVTAEDITERKSTQARLERSEQNLAHAQKIGHLGSWAWDVPNDRLEWSDELYRIFGAVSYTHLRAHETVLDLVCRLLLEKKKSKKKKKKAYAR